MTALRSWEGAVAWLLAQPDQQALVRDCYYDRPARAAAARYAASEEWAAIQALLPAPTGAALDLGAGNGIAAYALASAGWSVTAAEPDPSALVGAGAIRALAREAALPIQVVECPGESLPFADGSFELVLGHAVLHHIPDLDLAMREVLRVLKPGGRFVFAGEPTRRGDWVARRLSRATWWAASRVTQLPPLRETWARTRAELDESSRAAALESVVDVHTFDPDRLAALCLRAGAIDVRTVTEELTASWFGWPVRTFEAAVRPGALGWGWAMFAYKAWLRLSWLDEHVLTGVVPDELFYNVCVTGVKPV